MKILSIFEDIQKQEIQLSDESLVALYNEGKKFYPKLKIRKTNQSSFRFFINYPKNKGSFSIEGFKKVVAEKKIMSTIKWLETKYNIIVINYSNTTNSVYLKFGDKNIRISDHKNKNFDGLDILINWNTDSSVLVDQIKNFII